MTQTITRNRIQSIDLLRGIVMILMALDHVRDYFHHDSFYFDPTNLETTTVPLFLTRFITHFCAPVFIFLAGTSAFFVGNRMKTKMELSAWLIKRGFWLIFLEFTVVKFGWYFTLHFDNLDLIVIWAIGASMICLAAAIHLKTKFMLALSLLLVFGHNAFDFYTPPPDSFIHIVWNLLHVQGPFQLGSCHLFIVYPLIPWIALMMLGYLLGNWYTSDFNPSKRKNYLRTIGLSSLLLFVLLRLFNLYGEPVDWSIQPQISHSILSFINVSKYPPSLDYVLITLGISLLFLSVAENIQSAISKPIIVIGRVPMFYYILHIYLIHGLSLLAAYATGYDPMLLVSDQFISMIPELKGYGFSLSQTYLVWIIVVLCLYPLCHWYNNYKNKNRQYWWLSYL